MPDAAEQLWRLAERFEGGRLFESSCLSSVPKWRSDEAAERIHRFAGIDLLRELRAFVRNRFESILRELRALAVKWIGEDCRNTTAEFAFSGRDSRLS